jgi:hypothetical protein
MYEMDRQVVNLLLLNINKKKEKRVSQLGYVDGRHTLVHQRPTIFQVANGMDAQQTMRWIGCASSSRSHSLYSIE